MAGVVECSGFVDGYSIDGVRLNLGEKDKKWKGSKETFMFL